MRRTRTSHLLEGRIDWRHSGSLTFIFLLLFAASTAGDEPPASRRSVRQENVSSILFINVEATRPNGLVDRFTGTGFIVHPAGFVLTCNHLIPSDHQTYTSIKTTGAVGGRYEHPYPLRTVKREESLDLILLQLPNRASPWKSVGPGAQGQIDSQIVALGYPLNENLISTTGSIISLDGDGGRWLTDAALNRGMSGGPVFDREGAIVAVIAAGYDEVRGLNLLTPITFARGLLQLVDAWPLRRTSDSTFNKSRANALLLGYDGAFALAHALQGESITQERAGLVERIRQLGIDSISYPMDPLGEDRTALPAATFAQEVVGTLEARDRRLRSAFLVGWLGVISLNTPSLTPEGFDLRTFSEDAGFPERPDLQAADYLEYLVDEAHSTLGQTVQTHISSAPRPCRHPAHGIEGWNGENRWSADSGWRSGGSSPGEYCGAQLLARQQEYPQRKIELINSSEDHKSEYTPFKHDYYRYYCSFQEHWDPVYQLAISEHCPGG